MKLHYALFISSLLVTSIYAQDNKEEKSNVTKDILQPESVLKANPSVFKRKVVKGTAITAGGLILAGSSISKSNITKSPLKNSILASVLGSGLGYGAYQSNKWLNENEYMNEKTLKKLRKESEKAAKHPSVAIRDLKYDDFIQMFDFRTQKSLINTKYLSLVK